MARSRVDGRLSRWDAHRSERRQQILDAAIAVIEESAPGVELHVQEIAERAGIVRTVLYRHFDGRADLQRAVQLSIVAQLRETIFQSLTAEGSVNDIIERSVGAVVAWVAEHPNLYLKLEQELGDGLPNEFFPVLQEVAQRMVSIIQVGANLLGKTFDDAENAALDSIAFGIIGQVRGAVGHWARRTNRDPDAARLTQLLGRAIWFQIDGQARELGVDLPADVPLQDFLVQRQ